VELHLVNEVLTEKEQGLCTRYNNNKISATLVTKTLEGIKRMVNDPKENLFTVTGAMEDLVNHSVKNMPDLLTVS